jgi:hypothetical protein
MNVEQTLTDELRVVAGSVQPPPPPVAELVRRAEQARTRTRAGRAAAIGLVAAAVVAAILIGNQVGRPTSAPPPAHHSKGATSLPVGDPPRIPYVLGTTLYIGGEPQPGTWLGVDTVGKSSLASRAKGPGDYTVTEAVLFRGGVEVARVKDTISAMLSPDGTKVAWLDSAPDFSAAHLGELDALTGRVLGRLDLDPRTFDEKANEEAWLSIAKVDDDGTVTYGGVLASHTWRPGSAPVDHGSAMPSQEPPDIPNVVDLQMSPDGTWGAWLTDRRGRNVGNRTDYNGVLDGVTMQKPGDPGSRITIPLPAGTDLRGIVWESSTDVLLSVADNAVGDQFHYVRCSRLGRQCEIATKPATP